MRFYVPESPYRRFINVQNWQLELAKEFSPNYIRIVQGMLSIAFDRAIVLGIAKKEPVTNGRQHQKQKDESRFLDVGGISESDLPAL